MTDDSRATNPSGASLLDRSTAHPGSIDKSIFEKKSNRSGGNATSQGTVNPDYLRECREDNPEPASQSAAAAAVTLSNCRITTDPAQLATDQPFAMEVDLQGPAEATTGSVSFRLFCTFPKADGTTITEDQSATFDGPVKNGKATATGKLLSPKTLVKPGTLLEYHVVAQHPNAKEPLDSPKVQVEAFKPPKPLAIWSLGPAHFAFGSSFPLPSSCQEVDKLKALYEQDPNAVAAIFGHADQMPEPADNKTLSDRRAQAVHGLLTRDLDGWLKLSQGTKFDPWDLDTTQAALATLKNRSGAPYYSGAVDGILGPKTNEAIRSYQTDNGLKVDGIAGPKTKAKLYLAYMDAICSVKLKPESFVGDPPDTKKQWACCGCGATNPALVPSKPDAGNLQASKDKSALREKVSPNQRASVFLFPSTCKGAGNITFPCPACGDGAKDCQAQCRDDIATRQNPTDKERTCDADKDTFGCAFYTQLADLEKVPQAARQVAKPTITTLHLGIFNDGTGNNLEHDMKTGSVTNIGKLYNLYPQVTEGNELWDAHYVEGIGTDGEFDGLKQGLAIGFGKRIRESMDWLRLMTKTHPEAELKLHIFGFSRGAAISRALVNKLFDDDDLKKYELSKTSITIETLGIFDTVGSVGVPGNGIDIGFDLSVHASRVRKVIHLVAQSEVRASFDLWSIRCPPGLKTDWTLERVLKDGARSVGPEDWEDVRGRAPMPNPAWEEWVLPGMHADIGGGYGPEEWIPELPVPDALAGERMNDYVYRVLNERLDNGATPRGLTGTKTESKDTVSQRVKDIHERRYRHELAEFERVRREAQASGQPGAIPERYRSMPTLKTPGIRCLNNDLSRLALEVMRQRTTAAGVRWKTSGKASPEVRQMFAPLAADHILHKFIPHATDLNTLESLLQVGSTAYRRLVTECFHDSRWFLDLPQRKRDIFFGGRKS